MFKHFVFLSSFGTLHAFAQKSKAWLKRNCYHKCDRMVPENDFPELVCGNFKLPAGLGHKLLGRKRLRFWQCHGSLDGSRHITDVSATQLLQPNIWLVRRLQTRKLEQLFLGVSGAFIKPFEGVLLLL